MQCSVHCQGSDISRLCLAVKRHGCIFRCFQSVRPTNFQLLLHVHNTAFAGKMAKIALSLPPSDAVQQTLRSRGSTGSEVCFGQSNRHCAPCAACSKGGNPFRGFEVFLQAAYHLSELGASLETLMPGTLGLLCVRLCVLCRSRAGRLLLQDSTTPHQCQCRK